MADGYLFVCIQGPKQGLTVEAGPAASIATLQDDGSYLPNEPVGSQRCAFIFVTDIPAAVVPRLRNILEPHRGVDQSDPIDSYGEPNIKDLLVRKWGIRVADIPLVFRNLLVSDRYATVTWTQVKNFIRSNVDDSLLTDGGL